MLAAVGSKVAEIDKEVHLILTFRNTCDGVMTAIETLSYENISLAVVKAILQDIEVEIPNENQETSAKVLSA